MCTFSNENDQILWRDRIHITNKSLVHGLFYKVVFVNQVLFFEPSYWLDYIQFLNMKYIFRCDGRKRYWLTYSFEKWRLNRRKIAVFSAMQVYYVTRILYSYSWWNTVVLCKQPFQNVRFKNMNIKWNE